MQSTAQPISLRATNPRDLPVLLSQEEAAEFAGVHAETIARWRHAGKLRSTRTAPAGSGRVRIHRDDLLRLLGLEVA